MSPRSGLLRIGEGAFRASGPVVSALYDITLTPASRDGGVDIYAAKQLEIGSFLYIVECKKYAPENKAGVGLIRQLLGVVAQRRATAGILATTWQLSLKDYADVEAWLTGKV